MESLQCDLISVYEVPFQIICQRHCSTLQSSLMFNWSYLWEHMYNDFQTCLYSKPLVSPFSPSLFSSYDLITIGESFLKHPVHQYPFTCISYFSCCNFRIYELIWVWLNMRIVHTNVCIEFLGLLHASYYFETSGISYLNSKNWRSTRILENEKYIF